MTTVAFDIDGTLLKFNNKPNYPVIEFFHKLEGFGCQMYIWSGGGLDYARTIRNRLGLTADVITKGSILIDIAIDDEEVNLGNVNICVQKFSGDEEYLINEKVDKD